MQYPPPCLQAADAAQRLRLSARDRRGSATAQTLPEGPMSKRRATPLVRRFEPEIAMHAGRHSKAADISGLDLIESLTATFRAPADPHKAVSCRIAGYQPHRHKDLAGPLRPKDLQLVRQAAQAYPASLRGVLRMSGSSMPMRTAQQASGIGTQHPMITNSVRKRNISHTLRNTALRQAHGRTRSFDLPRDMYSPFAGSTPGAALPKEAPVSFRPHSTGASGWAAGQTVTESALKRLRRRGPRRPAGISPTRGAEAEMPPAGHTATSSERQARDYRPRRRSLTWMLGRTRRTSTPGLTSAAGHPAETVMPISRLGVELLHLDRHPTPDAANGRREEMQPIAPMMPPA